MAGVGGGNVLLGIFGGVCRPVVQVLKLLPETKLHHFSYPFSDQDFLLQFTIRSLQLKDNQFEKC